ncbi:outer membrane beta-barrel protein [soil metagenome]
MTAAAQRARRWTSAVLARALGGAALILLENGVPAYATPTQTEPPTPPASEAQSITLPRADRKLVSGDQYIALPIDELLAEDVMVARERNPADRSARGVAVLMRKRPNYDPPGLHAGGFTVFPAISLSPEYSSNVFREPRGVSDAVGTVRADVVARSNWRSNQLILDGFVQRAQFANQSSQDATTYRARAAGRLDIDRNSFLALTVLRQRIVEDRGGVGEVLSPLDPVRYDQTGALASARTESGSFWAEFNGGFDRFTYTVQNDATRGSQDFRNYDRYQAGGALGYRITRDRSIFVSGREEIRQFTARATPRRDVHLLELLGGIDSEITPLIRGRLAAGYLLANFDDPTVPDRSGFALDASISYLFSELTTFTLAARRTLRNVASANSVGAIVTTVRLEADHELFRNVILSPAVTYETADYSDTHAVARVIEPEFIVRWLINRRWRANAILQYRNRTGRGFAADRDYASLNLSMGLTLQF